MYTAQEYRAILEISKDEARAAGLAEGLAEGTIQKAIAIAKNMLTAGLDLNLIVSCTGLTEAEVKALQQN